MDMKGQKLATEIVEERMALIVPPLSRTKIVCAVALFQPHCPGLPPAGGLWAGVRYRGADPHGPGVRLRLPVLSALYRDAGQQPGDGAGLCALPVLRLRLHGGVHPSGRLVSPTA